MPDHLPRQGRTKSSYAQQETVRRLNLGSDAEQAAAVANHEVRGLEGE